MTSRPPRRPVQRKPARRPARRPVRGKSPARPAKTETATQRATQDLKRLVAEGGLPPGERLPGERRLAEEMGVSRVTIRAALQNLKAQGLLTSVWGGGTRVVSAAPAIDRPLDDLVRLDSGNLLDLAEIRMALETWAARRAAVRAGAADIRELAAIVTAMGAEEGRSRKKAELDMRFHLAIAKASDSAVYRHILAVIRNVLRDVMDLHRYELFAGKIDDRALLAQHRAIFEAIKAKDPARAEEAMAKHLHWVIDRLAKAGGRRKRP